MKSDKKDGVSDVAENLPSMSSRPEGQPEGTVVGNDGSLVTLDEKPTNNTSLSSTKGSMNS